MALEGDAEGKEHVSADQGPFFVGDGDGLGINHDAEVIAFQRLVHKLAGFGVEFFEGGLNFVWGEGQTEAAGGAGELGAAFGVLEQIAEELAVGAGEGALKAGRAFGAKAAPGASDGDGEG